MKNFKFYNRFLAIVALIFSFVVTGVSVGIISKVDASGIYEAGEESSSSSENGDKENVNTETTSSQESSNSNTETTSSQDSSNTETTSPSNEDKKDDDEGNSTEKTVNYVDFDDVEIDEDSAGEWHVVDGKYYWFEYGVRQGYNPDDDTYRGKEIYDPESDAWYWLDNVQGGAKAVSKDVYQESLAGPWGDIEGANGDRYGKWVRYDSEGHMIKGWSVTADGTYYFDYVYGTMAKGDVTLYGVDYHFDENTGIMDDCSISLDNHWEVVDGVEYWYEGGVRQGYNPFDETYRGKEIYDPESDAWYWLDNIQKGAKAVSKDVYQESLSGPWGDIEKTDENGKTVMYGKWVRYDSKGHMIKGWSTVDGKTYYFDPVYGTMAKGSVYISGVNYVFDKITGIRTSVFSICLDAGHGGKDSGASSSYGVEKNLNLAIMTGVANELKSRGYYITCTRYTDKYLTLQERCDVSNDFNASLFVSIHMNSSGTNPMANGVEGYYIADLPSDPRNPEDGKKLSDSILKRLVGLGFKLRGNYQGSTGDTGSNYYVNGHTNATACLIECGFITNEDDVKMITNETDVVAKAIANGIEDYIKNNGLMK